MLFLPHQNAEVVSTNHLEQHVVDNSCPTFQNLLLHQSLPIPFRDPRSLRRQLHGSKLLSATNSFSTKFDMSRRSVANPFHPETWIRNVTRLITPAASSS